METIALATVAVAWLAILLWGVVECTRRLLEDDGALPLFGLLERQGLTLRQVEESVGMNEFAQAARRCALCSSRPNCSADPIWCPNEPLLRRLKSAGEAP